MSRLALIGGHSILGEDPAAGFERRVVPTPRGDVELHERGDLVLLQRHGIAGYSSAPQIDHGRNLAALAELGCDRILAVSSVGGLRRELGVGTVVCPDDFIALQLGLSLSEGRGGERVPGFDAEWRATVLAAWRSAAEPEIRDGGVYWQA